MAFRVRKVFGTCRSLNEWLFGSEKSSGLSRNAPQRSEIFSSSFATAWIAPKTAITSTLCFTPKLKHMAFANIAHRLTILSPSLWSPEKRFVKVRPGYSINLVLSYVVKEVKLKITVKCRSSGRLRFEDIKRFMSPETHPQNFGTFEKGAPHLNFPDPTPCVNDRDDLVIFFT